MDAVSAMVTVPASSAKTIIQESTNTFNVNQSNNNTQTQTQTHANAHTGSNSLTHKTTNNVISSNSSSTSNSNMAVGGSSSNSSCSSSSTSSNSSGYGSSTTTPTNNYDLQQTTPTTTPIPTTPILNAEHIIPVATVAAVTPFYNESIATHNLETYHHHHTQQQQQQQHHYQYADNHLQTNLQQQHHQYLPRQQYYSPYGYQQTAPTHNLSDSTATPAVAPYNMLVPSPFEMSTSVVAAPSYSAGQYKPSSSTGATGYERIPIIKPNVAPSPYNHHQQQQQQQQQQQHQHQHQHHQSEVHQPKATNQQTHFNGLLATSKSRSSSLISSSTNNTTSKPQAAATPFYANPTPFYDNFKHKMPLEYHDTYSNSPPTTVASYHQQQKLYAAVKSQLQEASYGSPAGLNSNSLYANTTNFFPGATAGLNLSSTTYDKYMYSHNSATGYSTAGHLGNEAPPEVGNYRKSAVGNTASSSSWPWGVDYTSGNSRSIPPPAGHIPTATVAPTHATHLPQNPTVLARDNYYMGHDKYGGVKYDKYSTAPYQQPYVSPPSTNRHLWPNTPHTSNLAPLSERHLIPPALPSRGLHTTPYFPNNSTTNLNSRQSCCSQPYQPQSCYYPASHTLPHRLPHNQAPTVAQPTGGYFAAQQPIGQSPHLNALAASCKYGGVIPDYGNGNKMKNSNDLYLNTHHYDNNPASHNFGYGAAHSSQPLYNTNVHQSMTHGSTPTSLLTSDPLSANPTSFTNDLSLTTSNFDNYHLHFDTHPSQQPLTGIHNPQPPPSYGVAVTKRALLDYRKPIQPQPPPTIADDCYSSLTSRDHYNQQELLNTPETTTIFGEYEAHRNNATGLATEILTDDAQRDKDENSKNLSLRDFIANWNDDEDEYQNNEEMSFDQDTVINEVLQTAPIDQEAAVIATDIPAAATAVEEMKTSKTSLMDIKDSETLEQSVKTVENLTATLSDAEANQYVNLPDIVIDIEKSNNVNNSITTPTASPIVTPPINEVNNAPLSLTNFDVEKELDELNLKKPAQQNLAKDLNDMKDSKSIITPQLSLCKNLASQFSFENLTLETTNKTVLNTITTGLITNNNSELNEQYFKDIEGYESSSSRQSNESAFEKEYETFINKITNDTCATKSGKEKNANDAEMEMDFEKNVQDFSKFYKRKRKLKEVELKQTVAVTQKKKRLKTTEATKVNKSNFPQVYTKKSRNKEHKTKLHSPHKRKPLSPYYKIIRAIRRFGLYRQKRVREYMTELKDKHLPLIKRQSIKNYAHDITQILFDAKTLKALCIEVINTDEFRQTLFSPEQQEAEEKHICTDPSCETCDVIRSLMETESFETTLMQPTNENNVTNATFVSEIYCAEDNNGTITILEAAPNMNDLNFDTVEPTTMISSEIENVYYSKETFPAIDTKDINKYAFNSADMKVVAKENVDLEEQWTDEIAKTSDLDSLQTESNTALNINSHQLGFTEIDKQTFDFHSEILEQPTTEAINAEIDNLAIGVTSENCCELNRFERLNAVESEVVSANNSLNAQKSLANLEIVENILAESNKSSIGEIATTGPLESKNVSEAKQNEEDESESESESGNSESSESDAESNSSSDIEDKSTEDSRDSHKKYNKNNCKKSTDTDTEDMDTEAVSNSEDETVNSDSDQSYRSESMEKGESSGKRKRKETFEAAILYREHKRALKSSPSPGDRKKHAENLNHSSDHADSTSEDENTASSPQRIVIRIKKSLSRRDQGLKVENVFEKPSRMQAESNNRTVNETKDENMATEKSKVVLNNCDLNSNPGENIFENSVDTLASRKLDENENTENKSIIKPGSLKLVLRRQDFFRDSSFESESEDESSSYKKFENPQQKSVKEKESIETYAGREEVEEISTAVTTSRKLSPRREAEDFEKGLERLDEFDNDETSHITLEANVTSEKTSALNSTHLKPYSIEKKIEHSIENYGGENPLESRSENEEEKAETISSFVTKSPKQKHFDEVKVVEEKSVENKTKNTIPEAILSYLTLKPISNNAKENNAGTECENVLENQIGDEVCDSNLELNSNIFAQSSESGPLPKDLIAEHSSEANATKFNELENKKILLEDEEEEEDLETSKLSAKDDYFSENEAECITILSPCHILVPIQDDIRKKTSSFENIEIYDLTSSDSEQDSDEDLENETRSQGDVQEINLSSSENSCYFEYESDDNDETLKSSEHISNSNPIVISDDESMDTFNSDEELQATTKTFRKTSTEAAHQIESDSDFSNSEESQIPSSINKKNQFFRGKEEAYQKNSKNFQSNELKTTEQGKGLKQSADLRHESLEEDGYIQCEYSNSKYFFEIEKNLPERVMSTEFDDESHYDLNDDKMQEREDLQLQDESLTNFDKRYCNKNIEDEVIPLQISQTSEVHKDISEKNSLEENESVLESKIAKRSLQTKNDALQKTGITKTEDLNCSRENFDDMETTGAESTSETRIGALNDFLEIKEVNTKLSMPDIRDPIPPEAISSITLNDEHNIGESIMHDNMLEDIKNTALETCRPIREHNQNTAKNINEKLLNLKEPIVAERIVDTSTESCHSQQYIPKHKLRESAVFDEYSNSIISQENENLEHNIEQPMTRDHTTDSEEKIILEETKNTTAVTCFLTSKTNTTLSQIFAEDANGISNISEKNEIHEHKMDEIMLQDHTTYTEQQIIGVHKKSTATEISIPTSETETIESKISAEDKPDEKETFEHQIHQTMMHDHTIDSQENIIIKETKTTAPETYILTSETNATESEISAEDTKEYSNIPKEIEILEENIDQITEHTKTNSNMLEENESLEHKMDQIMVQGHTTESEEKTLLEDTNSKFAETCILTSEVNTKESEISAEDAKISSNMPEENENLEHKVDQIMVQDHTTKSEEQSPKSETNTTESEISAEDTETSSNIPEGNKSLEHKMEEITEQDHTTESQEETLLDDTGNTVAEICIPTHKTNTTESEIYVEDTETSSNMLEENESLEHKMDEITVQDHTTESEDETILEDTDSIVADICIPTLEKNTTESEISAEDAETSSNMLEENESLENKMDEIMVQDHTTEPEEETTLQNTHRIVADIYIPTLERNTTESKIYAEDAETSSNMLEETESLEQKIDEVRMHDHTTESEEETTLQETQRIVADIYIPTLERNTIESEVATEDAESSYNMLEETESLEQKMDEVRMHDYTTESEEEATLQETQRIVADIYIPTLERNTIETEVATEDAESSYNMLEETESLEQKMDEVRMQDYTTESEEETSPEDTDRIVADICIPTLERNTTESEVATEDAESSYNILEETDSLEQKMDEVRMQDHTTESEEETSPTLEMNTTESEIAAEDAETSSNMSEETENIEPKRDETMVQDRTTESEEETTLEDTESTVAKTSTLTCIKNIPQDDIEDMPVSNKEQDPNILEDGISNTQEIIVQIPSVERDINVRTTQEKDNLIKSPKINKAEELVEVSHNTTSATFKVYTNDISLIRDCKAVAEYEIEEKENVKDTQYLEEPILQPTIDSTKASSQAIFEVLDMSGNVKRGSVEAENYHKITEVGPNCTHQVHNKEVFEEISSPNQTNTEYKTEAYNVVSEPGTEKFDGTSQVHNKEAFEEVSNQNEITARNETEENEKVSDGTTADNKTEALETKLNLQIENFTKTAAEKSETLGQAITENPDTLENKQMEKSENISDHGTFIDKRKAKVIIDEVKELDNPILEGSFHESEIEQSVTSLEPNYLSKSSPESELTSETWEETNTANKGEEDELVSTNILTEVSQVDINSLDDVPRACNQMEYCVSLGQAVFEKSDTKEEKFEAEFKNSNDSKKVIKASVEAFVVDNENSFPAEEEEVTRSENSEISACYAELGLESSDQSNDKLDCVKPQVEEKSTEHQPEHSNLSSNDTSSQNVLTKDSSTSGDLSREFLGFKNQSSFEDGSGDFHGFEDLEEVTRIRQEIENLNDDCAANDGFLSNLTPNRQPHESSTTSLTDSTSSEINELEALEKELSQHQPKIPTDEDDVKETEKHLPMQPMEIASSNDIEHIKQMLESDEEPQTDGEEKIENLAHTICKAKSVASSNNISKDTLSSVNSIIPKLSDLCRAALNSSLNSNSNLAQQHTPQTSTVLVEHELSVEEALAEMFRQAGVLLSDPEDCDTDIPSPGQNETQTHDVLLINLQEILNSDNNDVYVLQCNMNENILNVVQSAQEHADDERKDNDPATTERVNTVQIILDTQNPEPQIHIISSDSESEVIILSDDDSEFSYRPFSVRQERVTIPFINDGDINNSNSSFDISTIHHEEIVPDNLDKFLQEEFYKYLHEKYVQRNISKYYHANRILRKYKKRFIRSYRQLD